MFKKNAIKVNKKKILIKLMQMGEDGGGCWW